MGLFISATRFELLGANLSSSQPPLGSIYSVLGTDESEVNMALCGALRGPCPGCPSQGQLRGPQRQGEGAREGGHGGWLNQGALEEGLPPFSALSSPHFLEDGVHREFLVLEELGLGGQGKG